MSRRSDWLAEWLAEAHAAPRAKRLSFVQGALPDALALLRWHFSYPTLESPAVCLAVLASLAALLGAPSASLLALAPALVRLVAPSWRRPAAAAFLLSKVLLAVLVAALATSTLVLPLTAGALAPHVYAIPCYLACRWAFRDQRKRCPVCLCRVGNPVRIGRLPSFFEPVGIESICRRGHGFLFEPLPVCELGSRRWTSLA
ncbi:MAG: hypothetical protein SFV54_18950 [Bryobacteraceae bacterium]|nr:hypothetical protein [Bryobacteraceae bacterium]